MKMTACSRGWCFLCDFAGRRLRQAVSLSLDSPQLVKELLNSYGEPADTIYTSRQ